MHFRPSASSFQQGYSLIEILATIAIMGILAGIGISAASNFNEAARRTKAEAQVAMLNSALRTFCQSKWDLHTVPNDANTTDEFLVLRSLQYKPSTTSTVFDPAAPYYPPNWNPTSSSKTSEFRARWTGQNFSLLLPGTAGNGLLLASDGSDHGADYLFPPGYTPEPASN